MLTEKDQALIDFLLKATDRGEIRWEPTAQPDRFTTSFKGKYSVIVDKTVEDNGPYYWLKLTDADDQELLFVSSSESEDIRPLFYLVRRRSLNVDAAIDEIIGDKEESGKITDKDIPF